MENDSSQQEVNKRNEAENESEFVTITEREIVEEGTTSLSTNHSNELTCSSTSELIEERNEEQVQGWLLEHKKQLIQVSILLILAIVSFFVLGSVLSDPATYTGINETLDEKKGNVMALMATTTGASAVLSMMPNDIGGPIAEKLVDLTSYFMVILAVIYLEKFLVTVFGALSFKILIPISLAIIGISLFQQAGTITKANLQKIGVKAAAFGLALFLVVPSSVWISNTIDQSFESTLESANASMQESTTQIEESTIDVDSEESETGFFEGLFNKVGDGISSIVGAAEDAVDNIGRQLNTMIDTIAVMIVTSCLVPILVLAFFLWMIKLFTGLDFGTPSTVMSTASKKGRSITRTIRSSIK